MACNFCSNPRGDLYPAGQKLTTTRNYKEIVKDAQAPSLWPDESVITKISTHEPMICEKCLRGKFSNMSNEQFKAFLVEQAETHDHEAERKRDVAEKQKNMKMRDGDKEGLRQWLHDEATVLALPEEE